jgi:hypothetical protein
VFQRRGFVRGEGGGKAGLRIYFLSERDRGQVIRGLTVFLSFRKSE